MHEPVAASSKAWRVQQAAPVQEGVPATRAARERLRQAASDLAEDRDLVPPLSLEELEALAAEALARAGLDERYLKFAVVLASNAAWADAVAAVPYGRRLLLLPQCLRDTEGCEAEIDEFGLVCARCGRCPIHAFQAEAERLGYVVLVAEGTTVVTSLIESGQIDAIVGVSCLAVLERVFPYMEAAAIPGIAVPLLRDGCAETCVDAAWVWDLVQLTSADRTRRLKLDALRAEVEGWFAPESVAAVLGEPRTRTEALAAEWLARSGKRWRPFLAVCAFEALREEPQAPLPDDLRGLAVAIECFHKASLVHDDIEDDDAERYGEKTLHEAYGIPIALNVGDLLVGEGYRLIAESALPPERQAAMLRAATTGHRNLCLGQGEELAWTREPRPLAPEQVLDIYRQKTAPAFEVALCLGAVRAGADDGLWSLLNEYSEALGIAYQIRDELLDFRGEAERDGVLAPSLVLALAWQRADAEGRRVLEPAWRQPWRLGPQREAVEGVLDRLGAEDLARGLLGAYRLKAVRALQPLRNASLKGLLRRVVGKIFDEIPAGS
ncbi:MAG: polyprenyl synthetase family protein [Planctomycetota bacterium]